MSDSTNCNEWGYDINEDSLTLAFILYITKKIEFKFSSLEHLMKAEDYIFYNLFPILDFYCDTDENTQERENYIQDSMQYEDEIDGSSSIEEQLEIGETTSFDNFSFYQVELKRESTYSYYMKITLKDDGKEFKDSIDYHFKLYENDDLMPSGDNILSQKGYRNELYNYLTEREYNLKNFHILNNKHIHALFYAYINGQIDIYEGTLEVGVNEDCCVSFECYINAQNFINSYNESELGKPSINDVKKPNIDKEIIKDLKTLKDVEIDIISAMAYLSNTTYERVTYKMIAEFLTKNGIYRITDNNIKQKVKDIYMKLGVQSVEAAVLLLKEHNLLKSYNN